MMAPSGDVRRPRDPGLVFGGLSAALILLLASVALTEAAPAPPAIAEFAPQAVEQIKESPAELQAAFGSQGGGGGGPAGTTTTTTAPTQPEVLDDAPLQLDDAPLQEAVPRTRRCVGDPPRQTEDPQSPPCVPFWIGDNGGATARGVTSNEVRVAIPAWSLPNDSGQRRKIYDSLTPFFNDRFEFYGRHVVLVPIGPVAPPTGTGAEYDQKLRAIAAEAASKNVFASFGLTGGDTGAYNREVVRRGIVLVGGRFDTPETAKNTAPYSWSYGPPLDVMVRGMGEWACKQLVGRPADFAKNERMGQPRRFGVLYGEATGGTYDPIAVFDRMIRACGGEPVVPATAPIWTPNRAADPSQNAAYRTNAAKVCDPQQRVTTIVAFLNMNDIVRYQQAFSSQACYPEWIVDGSHGPSDKNQLFRQGTLADQRNGSSIGLTWNNQQIPFVDEPGYQALKESNPNFQYDTSPYAQGAAQSWTQEIYRDFLVLASGLQTAGPRLTPEAFEAGLHRTVFPNPDHPLNPAKVDFTDGDYWMVDDAAELWWSEDAQDPGTSSPGAWCYTHGGAARYRLGTFPREPSPLFQPPCSSGAR